MRGLSARSAVLCIVYCDGTPGTPSRLRRFKAEGELVAMRAPESEAERAEKRARMKARMAHAGGKISTNKNAARPNSRRCCQRCCCQPADAVYPRLFWTTPDSLLPLLPVWPLCVCCGHLCWCAVCAAKLLHVLRAPAAPTMKERCS